jgi:adenylate kinase
MLLQHFLSATNFLRYRILKKSFSGQMFEKRIIADVLKKRLHNFSKIQQQTVNPSCKFRSGEMRNFPFIYMYSNSRFYSSSNTATELEKETENYTFLKKSPSGERLLQTDSSRILREVSDGLEGVEKESNLKRDLRATEVSSSNDYERVLSTASAPVATTTETYPLSRERTEPLLSGDKITMPLAKKELEEIKDPVLIFDRVWKKLETKYGRENMRFPKEIIFLMGAPGSGKGTNTPFILRERGITAPPIVMSELLAEHIERSKLGVPLVADAIVVELFLDRLLQSQYQNGVVIDGFPRTTIQVEVVKLLHEKMIELKKEFSNTPYAPFFRRPCFCVTVLFVDDETSVQRQMARGRMVREHNEKVRKTGIGTLLEERPSDFSEEAARARYAIFANHYDTLLSLKKHFHFNIINASGKIEEVEKLIVQEFSYQSQFELAEETYDVLQHIPTAKEVIRHARQELVSRLDSYAAHHQTLFKEVAALVQLEFFPKIRQNQFGGRAIIRTNRPIFDRPLAVDMALDILAERGFFVHYDYHTEYVPFQMDPKTGHITCSQLHTHVFTIEWKPPTIRNNN